MNPNPTTINHQPTTRYHFRITFHVSPFTIHDFESPCSQLTDTPNLEPKTQTTNHQPTTNNHQPSTINHFRITFHVSPFHDSRFESPCSQLTDSPKPKTQNPEP
ncbi:hypothetical protein [Mariniflexile rhizosphaerae]|uniref:hypothetical protein n=1 Tax=unclassified Mariniflexile TaxID=2643887 RepID=UPI0013C34B16|nr:hypothetical protein [Mariniflexile sp. TRM1-10]